MPRVRQPPFKGKCPCGCPRWAQDACRPVGGLGHSWTGAGRPGESRGPGSCGVQPGSHEGRRVGRQGGPREPSGLRPPGSGTFCTLRARGHNPEPTPRRTWIAAQGRPQDMARPGQSPAARQRMQTGRGGASCLPLRTPTYPRSGGDRLWDAPQGSPPDAGNGPLPRPEAPTGAPGSVRSDWALGEGRGDRPWGGAGEQLSRQRRAFHFVPTP